MKIGIVGSRSFPQLKLVEWFVRDLPKGCIIVSGGANGVDDFATQTARERELDVIELLPDLEGCKKRFEFTKQYYARNQKIADNIDLLVAFTEKDRGGTWDTIKRVRVQNKPVKIIRPSAFFPGEDQSPQMTIDDIKPQKRASGRKKGKGPFHIKRVSIGSCALKLKRYISTEDYADFVNDKDNNPEALGKRMLPEFIKFFNNNNKFGVIHALTQPPKSIRNIKRKHPMDIVCKGLEKEFAIPFVEMFKPWDKRRRGNMAAHPEIEICPNVRDYIGKVVFVLDDVSTTNYTLMKAVKSLTSFEIHTHAVCYMQYA